MNSVDYLRILDTANALPANIKWWGFDYLRESDAMVFHAVDIGNYQMHVAQLSLFGSSRLFRPGSLDHCAFIDGGADSQSARHSKVIIRASLPEGVTDFLADYTAIDLVQGCFTRNETEYYSSFRNTGNVLAAGVVAHVASSYELLRGCDLKWESMSARLNCPFYLSVSGSNALNSVRFDTPYLLDVARVMHNVSVRLPTDSDIAAIRVQLGVGAAFLIRYPNAKDTPDMAIDDLTIIEADEGLFWIYSKLVTLVG